MPRKIVILIAAALSTITSIALASEPNDYIAPGRALLFDGSLSGIQSAYHLFDEGLKDGNCPECQTNRELRFFHAASGTAMLMVRDDGNSINSLFELLREFGINVSGEHWSAYFDPNTLGINAVINEHDVYEFPADAPDIKEIRNILEESFVPEIQIIIDDLSSIEDSPANRFKIYLEPSEIRIFFHSDSDVFNSSSPDYDPNSRFLKPVEVDYGEVLLLKGILTVLKGQLKAKAAYDSYVDSNDKLLEKIYGNSFKINEDLLLPRPEILNVLPTINDSNDGAAILAQARQD